MNLIVLGDKVTKRTWVRYTIEANGHKRYLTNTSFRVLMILALAYKTNTQTWVNHDNIDEFNSIGYVYRLKKECPGIQIENKRDGRYRLTGLESLEIAQTAHLFEDYRIDKFKELVYGSKNVVETFQKQRTPSVVEE